MEKTSQKVTKDPKRVEAARKGKENYMNKLKVSILNDGKKGSGDTSNASNETTSTTNTDTTRPGNIYIYGAGILAVLAIGACVFSVYSTSQAATKKQVNEK